MGRAIIAEEEGNHTESSPQLLQRMFAAGDDHVYVSALTVNLDIPGEKDDIPFAGYFSGQEVASAVKRLRQFAVLSGFGMARPIRSGDQVILPGLTLEIKPVNSDVEGESDFCRDILDVTAILQMEGEQMRKIRLEFNTQKCKDLLISAGHELCKTTGNAFSAPQIPASGLPGCALVFMRRARPEGYRPVT